MIENYETVEGAWRYNLFNRFSFGAPVL